MSVETWAQRECDSILKQLSEGITHKFSPPEYINSYYWYADSGDMEPYLWLLKNKLMVYGADAEYEYFTSDNPDVDVYDWGRRRFTRHGKIRVRNAVEIKVKMNAKV